MRDTKLVELVARALCEGNPDATGVGVLTSSSHYKAWEYKIADARKALETVATWLAPGQGPVIHGHDATASEMIASTLKRELIRGK